MKNFVCIIILLWVYKYSNAQDCNPISAIGGKLGSAISVSLNGSLGYSLNLSSNNLVSSSDNANSNGKTIVIEEGLSNSVQLSFELTGLEPNKEYTVSFFQYLNEVDDNSSVLFWNISGYKAPFLKTEKQQVSFEFIPSSTEYTLEFTPIVFNYDTGTDSVISVRIDNLLVSKKGTCNLSEIINSNNTSFQLETGNYLLSAWVKEDVSTPVSTYSNAKIRIGNIVSTYSGNIIDGWQRVYAKFSINSSSTSLSVRFLNESEEHNAYYDDIRIHPLDGNMKSFVYDPITQRLMAELDENNYATFYEYDKEGGLVRVKKETVDGVYTIQETRSGNSKINLD